VKPSDRDSGVAGMLRSALWLDSVCGLEVLSMGRSAIDKDDCVLELCGTQLHVRVALRGGWVWLSACGLDEGPPEAICNFPDGPQGWSDCRRLIANLERSGIKSLKTRPIQIGDEGPNAYLIY
jgi:hypothetical protein